MNKILTTLLLAGVLFACKPKSEDIKPIAETACKKLSYKKINSNNAVEDFGTYTYDKTSKLIEFQGKYDVKKHEYDDKGNLLKTFEYAKNQISGALELWSETHYTYNSANQLIKLVFHGLYANSNGNLYQGSQTLYEYHANGKLKKLTIFYGDSTVPNEIEEYNEKGSRTYNEVLGESYIRIEYNAANLMVKSTNYYYASNQKVEYKEEYDSQNRWIKSSTIINGIFNNSMNFEYDAQGRRIANTVYLADGTISSKSTTEYTGENYKYSWYNSFPEETGYTIAEVKNGLVMKSTTYHNDQLFNSLNYTYESHKNMIRKEELDSRSQLKSLEEWAYLCE
ncbi:MAG TPA: hypothetical protein VGE24_09515 [Emticicia sp.]